MLQKCRVIFSSFLGCYSKTEKKKRHVYCKSIIERSLAVSFSSWILSFACDSIDSSLPLHNEFLWEGDLIVILVTNVKIKFNVVFPFYWKKHPHIILVVSDDCHQFPIFSSFWFLFSLFLGVLATKNNLFKYMYRQHPFFLGILAISHIKGNNDIFIVSLLHNFPNAYFRLVQYPFVILTFLTPEKILLEIFHTLLETSHSLLLQNFT